jgi:hypothetical protein
MLIGLALLVVLLVSRDEDCCGGCLLAVLGLAVIGWLGSH